jgi:Right handed beta helix region
MHTQAFLVAVLVIAVAAESPAQTGVQITRDERAILINKDVGDQRWAITYDPDSRTATGNVFFPSGGDPAFVWCNEMEMVGDQVSFACFGADKCNDAPCSTDAWTFIDDVTLPFAFFLPPGTPPLIEVGSIAQLVDVLASAPAAATIRVRAGTYIVNTAIDVVRDDVTIEGEGDRTLFVLAAGANDPVFVIGEPTPFSPATTHRNITLRQLRIDGNREQQSSELSDTPGREFLHNNCVTVRQASGVVLEYLGIESCRSAGIALEQACDHVTVRDVTSFDNQFDGIAWDGLVSESSIVRSVFRNNLAAGISFDVGPADNEVANDLVRDNATVGIFVSDSRDNRFRRLVIEGNGEDGIFIRDGEQPGAASTGNLFEDLHLLRNGRNGIWQSGAQSTGNVVRRGLCEENGANAIEQSFPATAPLILEDACSG